MTAPTEEFELRKKIARQILAEGQFEGVQAQRVIGMCAMVVLRPLPLIDQMEVKASAPEPRARRIARRRPPSWADES